MHCCKIAQKASAQLNNHSYLLLSSWKSRHANAKQTFKAHDTLALFPLSNTVVEGTDSALSLCMQVNTTTRTAQVREILQMYTSRRSCFLVRFTKAINIQRKTFSQDVLPDQQPTPLLWLCNLSQTIHWPFLFKWIQISWNIPILLIYTHINSTLVTLPKNPEWFHSGSKR